MLVNFSCLFDPILPTDSRQIPQHQRAFLESESLHLRHNTLHQFLTEIRLRTPADQSLQHVHPRVEGVFRQVGLDILQETDPSVVLLAELLAAELEQEGLELARSEGQSATVVVLEDRLGL